MSGATLDGDDLRLVEVALDRSLDWLERQRDHFSFRYEADPREQIQLLKPFAEYLLTLDTVQWLGLRDARLMDDMAWAWRESDEGDTLVALLTARPDLVDIASIYANFSRWEFHNARLERRLGQLWGMRTTHSAETPLWTRLALHYNFWRLGLTGFPVDLLSGCWFSREPEPWTISEDVAYAITHEVFYFTEFGAAPQRLTPDVRHYLRLWLPVWTRCFHEEGNWDLTAEWLMVAACLGTLDDLREYLLRLLAAQSPDGSYPSPSGAGQLLVRSHHDAERERFVRTYHTSLVGLLVAAMTLHLPQMSLTA